MNQMLKSIEEIHKQDVCLFKIGSFYHAFGRDTYILSYLFGYKIKEASIEKSWIECGFPKNSAPKVMAQLEEKKINYVFIDRRNNYDVDDKMDFGNLNRYVHFYEKAKKFVNHKRRINNITNYLLENIDSNVSDRQKRVLKTPGKSNIIWI